ncbi:hypothetical protein BDM02DRAFT_79589 [Thelephora ganbajun]|uniref:Uncharacterized protein n=1 Tax=Thelephora ganbajun TaxID=370292 RepID=A0ACB6ZXP8_THEGA|nr:hypothetical protein BDM02DRAFT_79589 [Thelephora ganbajun]
MLCFCRLIVRQTCGFVSLSLSRSVRDRRWPLVTQTHKERTVLCNEQQFCFSWFLLPSAEPGSACYHHHPIPFARTGLEHAMVSDDRSSLLEIPGAWISKELDLDLSLPASLTPPSSIQPACIRTSLKEPPTLPPCCDPLPSPSAQIVVRSTPRTSYHTLGPCKFDHRVTRAILMMPVGSKAAAEVAPQSTLMPFDCASNTSNSLLPSPIDAPPFPLPGEPAETLSGGAASIHRGIAGLSFGSSGSPLYKCNSDFGFSAVKKDLACKEFVSRDQLNYSVIDAFPSTTSINLVPSIPSIASDLHLHNFPASGRQPFEPRSVYPPAVEGDSSMFRRSEDGPDPVHETSTSSESVLDLCVPTAEETHHQTFWQENPSPRRPTVRIEVLSDVLQSDEQGLITQESFTYACKSLPYDAGFRPHAYVDNHEYTVCGKHHLEALADSLCGMGEFMEEGRAMVKSKHSTILHKLVGGKRMLKLMTFGPLKLQVTADCPNSSNCPPTLPPSSPPPPYSTPNKKRLRTLFSKTWSGPRPLSMFAVPKPGVEGKVVSSPEEFLMSLPAGGNPPPLSPLTSPWMHSVEIPQADAHGGLYGPSRVANQNPSPRSPNSSIFGRKERRSWLTSIRSLKDNPLMV